MQISDPEPRRFTPQFFVRGAQPSSAAWASNRPEESKPSPWALRRREPGSRRRADR